MRGACGWTRRSRRGRDYGEVARGDHAAEVPLPRVVVEARRAISQALGTAPRHLVVVRERRADAEADDGLEERLVGAGVAHGEAADLGT